MPQKITVIGFFVLLFTLFGAFLLRHDATFSQMENRYLAQPPALNADTVRSREFMEGFESFFSDQFFLRDSFVALKGDVEYAAGKREFSGVYVGREHLLRNVQGNNEHVAANIEAIKTFTRKADATVSVMLVPTAVAVLQDETPDYFPIYNQRDLITEVYWELDPIVGIDLYSDFYNRRGEYLYYRTDHHWTTLGAYYAYQQFCRQMRYTAKTLSDDFYIRAVADDFRGTLYSQSAYRRVRPDGIYIMGHAQHEQVAGYRVYDGTKWRSYESCYFPEYLETKDKYSYFLGQNQPVQEITGTGSGEEGTSRSILIVKDSFANSFAPFLVNHFDKITLVDLRYFNTSFTELVDPNGYDLVLILYSVDTFMGSDELLKLNW